MKVQIYTGSLGLVAKSGVGQAIFHQRTMLKTVGIDPVDRWEKDAPIHLNTVFPDSAAAALIARAKGRTVIYYGHSTEEDFKNSFIGSTFFSPLFKKWIIFCYNLGDIVITPTEYSKHILMSYGIRRPIVSLTNGIDTEFFKPSKEAGLRFREKYRLSEKEKAVISAGHLIGRKGLPEFIALARENPGVRFFWFGSTPMAAVPEEIRCAVEKAPENVTFPGFVSQEELRDAYCGADLFLFLSHEETEGIVVMEALACGVPTLLRDIPVYDEWLRGGENVYMAKDNTDFNGKLRGILSGKLPSLSEAGIEAAKERSMAAAGERLKEIYRRLGVRGK